MATAAESRNDRQWFIVGRWQEYEGEARANLLRIIAIGVFYIVQLISFYVLTSHDEGHPDFQVARTFHHAATALAVAGSLVSLTILLCLSNRTTHSTHARRAACRLPTAACHAPQDRPA